MLPGNFRKALAGIVGEQHVLEGDAAAGFSIDWTRRFQGQALAVVRPANTDEVAAVLARCTEAGRPVVPQGGNTGLVGGGVPLHGEVVLSLTRLTELGPVDREASQVTAGAGVTLARVGAADPDLDLGIQIASRDSATVGGAVATNAGGVRVLRYGPMRAQLRGIEAVLSDGTVVSHLAGLVKDNTGYDYPSLLAGSEGTLAVITKARLRLVPRPHGAVTAIIGAGSLDEVHALALAAVRQVPGLISAEFFTQAGLDILAAHAGLAPPLPLPSPAYLLLDAAGPGALDDLADLIGDRDAAVGETDADRRRLWSYRERHPEAAGFLGVPIKLDVSAPAAQWTRLATEAAGVVAAADPGARVITFGHVADGNVHVNIVPGPQAPADGRHQEALFSLVATLGGSISAEHGIGALKAPWLALARTEAERALFARIRGALDPAGTLNPHVLPRLSLAQEDAVDPIFSVVLDWFCGALLTAGQQRLASLLGGDKQRAELLRITRAATRTAVADVVDAQDREVIADALLREGPDSVLPDMADAASLRDRLVTRTVGPRLAVLAQQGYRVDAERLSAVLAARIAASVQANAARGGVLLQLAEWLRHQETTGLQRETVGVLLELRQLLARQAAPITAGTAPITAGTAKRTLPAGKGRFFTGRATELSRVWGAAESGGVVRIVAIDGMAGVGKTTFAVHAAHQIADLFPDGQFFVRLHGHTPGQRPTEPGTALATLLGNLGMSAEQIPAELDERAARWRDGTAGRRMLLVLDDAAGTSQVEHLLPGTDGPLVLITSRHRLKALPEATTIMLHVLAPADAAELLVRLSERDGLEPEDADVAEVTRLCGYLPLAISLTAGRFKHHGSWTTADLARHLNSAANRAAALRAEDVSVAAALDVSYQRLTAEQQRLFRLLALAPGPDVDAHAAAALGGISLDTADALLEDLYDAHLSEEPSPGRHRLHDLIRAHAATLVQADDPAERRAALDRLLAYYAHCARLADMYLARRSHTAGPLSGTVAPAYAPSLAAPGEAARWMRAELDNLQAAVRWDAQQDAPWAATAIAIAAHGFLRTSHLWDRALDIHTAALRAARKADDRLGEAETLNNLGVIQRLTQDYPSAAGSLTAAMDIYHGLGNRLGEANALNYLGVVQRLTGDPDSAAQSFLQALDMYRAIPDRLGQANALHYLGTLRQRTGDFAAAAASQRDALRLYEELGDRLGQADTWLGLGVAQLSMDEYPGAIASLGEAFLRYQEADSLLGQANALKYLGDARRQNRDDTAGTADLKRAFALFQELGSERGLADVLRYLR